MIAEIGTPRSHKITPRMVSPHFWQLNAVRRLDVPRLKGRFCGHAKLHLSCSTPSAGKTSTWAEWASGVATKARKAADEAF